MATCKDCDYWKLIAGNEKQINGVEMRHCHGRAPTVTAIMMQEVNPISQQARMGITEVTLWPRTGANCEACGDFKNGKTAL